MHVGPYVLPGLFGDRRASSNAECIASVGERTLRRERPISMKGVLRNQGLLTRLFRVYIDG
ncbi:hypothetical protein PUN4_1070033 [Paraburkholderia unamae]|nr:hypothetical protein PUN4_1070033 [Paraburkholderia unamae]